MRRPIILLVLFLAACSSTQELAPVPSTGTAPAVPPASTEPETPPTGSMTTTTLPVTTTTTALPPLQNITYVEVARIDFPIHMVPFIPGFELLATKDGRVWLYDGEQLSENPVLDISGQVHNEGERGLLALAVHPDDQTRVFLHYSANGGATTVSEFTWADGALSDERMLLQVDQPAANHNGGMIQFGPDGRLYLGLGDGGGANDTFGNGQNRDTLLGGLTAIDVDTGEAGLFQYGLRNPWRFWFDGDRVYVADVGQGSYEEVSVAPIEPDVNYGWSITEGLHCFRPSTGCETDGLTMPVVEVSHSDAGTCSITGGVVYHGRAIPELDGQFFYSDYCGGYLRSFSYDGAQLADEADWTEQVGNAGQVASFGTDAQGEMYVLTTERILQIVPVRSG